MITDIETVFAELLDYHDYDDATSKAVVAIREEFARLDTLVEKLVMCEYSDIPRENYLIIDGGIELTDDEAAYIISIWERL